MLSLRGFTVRGVIGGQNRSVDERVSLSNVNYDKENRLNQPLIRFSRRLTPRSLDASSACVCVCVCSRTMPSKKSFILT